MAHFSWYLPKEKTLGVWLGITPGTLTEGIDTTEEDDDTLGRGTTMDARREPRRGCEASSWGRGGGGEGCGWVASKVELRREKAMGLSLSP